MKHTCLFFLAVLALGLPACGSSSGSPGGSSGSSGSASGSSSGSSGDDGTDASSGASSTGASSGSSSSGSSSTGDASTADASSSGEDASSDAAPRTDASTSDGGAECASATDCRLFSSTCGNCACLGLPEGAPDPTCTMTMVSCLIDPCQGKLEACTQGKCTAGPTK